MTDEQHTDHAAEAREILLLAKVRGLLIRAAAADADALTSEDGDGRARKISSLVIALTRITEMEDRYESRAAGRNASPDARERVLAALRRDALRLIDLPDAEFRARYAAILDDAKGPGETSDGGLSRARPVSVEGAGA